MKSLLFILVAILAVSSVACFGISQEELQSALDEQAAAAQREAEGSAENHAQELADKDAAANAEIAEVQESLVVAKVEVESLQDQLTAAKAETDSAYVQVDNFITLLDERIAEVKSLENQLSAERVQVADLQDEMATSRTEITGLEDQLAAERSKVADIQDQLAAERSKVADIQDQLAAASGDASTTATQLNSRISRLEGQLSAAKRETTRAREETRWVSVSISGAPTLYGISPDAKDVRGLMVQCKEDGINRLYAWDTFSSQPGTYTTQASFDDERFRTEDLHAFESDAIYYFADIAASELWTAKTFSVKDTQEANTFDTNQLLRMFPTETAFCDGEQPKSN